MTTQEFLQYQELAKYTYKVVNDNSYNDDTVLQLITDKIYQLSSTCYACGVSGIRLKASGQCVPCYQVA